MNIALVSFTANGGKIRDMIYEKTLAEGNRVTVYEKKPDETLKQWVARQWQSADLIIYISACGIAVRGIAPHVKDKFTDPAVLVVDEMGNFCVSLLSGHVGGANEFALKMEAWIGSTPVISTATDLNGCWAVDVFAKKNNLQISDRTLAKDVSAQILKGNLIPVSSEVEISGDLPKGVMKYDGTKAQLGIHIGIHKVDYFENTLYLVPKVIAVGMGCRRGKEFEPVDYLFSQTLENENISKLALKNLVSIDLKAEEVAFLTLADCENLPFITYSAEELLAVAGDFKASEFVKSITGVDNVCERSAVLASQNGKLILNKTSHQGVTIALAVEEWRLSYE